MVSEVKYCVLMAYLCFSPPKPCNFQNPKDQVKWKKHFSAFD